MEANKTFVVQVDVATEIFEPILNPKVFMLESLFVPSEHAHTSDYVCASVCVRTHTPHIRTQGWKQLFQAIETESMDSDDFAFLMRGAFASVTCKP